MEPKLAEFSLEEVEELIWWLIHLLGDRVTLPKDRQFWDDNMPEDYRLIVEHDEEGNPILVAQALDWK